ncbi:MAG: GFA family protein [Alphaproteobacteria bacterium]
MDVDGGCHCGHVTYQAVIEPDRVFLCHCTDCQTLSGAAFRIVARVDEADFRLLSGTLKTYVKTAESGRLRAQCFCPECGTAIYATSVGDGPKVFGVRIATARQRDSLPPERHFWHGSA